MKTYEEVEQMLLEAVKRRRIETSDILRNGELIDTKYDNGLINSIDVMCYILGDYAYNSRTHELRKTEPAPEPIDMATKALGVDPGPSYYEMLDTKGSWRISAPCLERLFKLIAHRPVASSLTVEFRVEDNMLVDVALSEGLDAESKKIIDSLKQFSSLSSAIYHG